MGKLIHPPQYPATGGYFIKNANLHKLSMGDAEIIVLRYGHRIVRDARVTSHCCLVARALGADKIIIEGLEDSGLRKSVQEIVQSWGGKFSLAFTDSWKKEVQLFREKGFKIVHLTMYGIPFTKKMVEIKKQDKILVLIGSQKVVKGVYALADYNVSVTLQPHSEIGALSVFLYALNGEDILEKKFSSAELEIVPSEKGKETVHPK